jgi:hypothetical protein
MLGHGFQFAAALDELAACCYDRQPPEEQHQQCQAEEQANQALTSGGAPRGLLPVTCFLAGESVDDRHHSIHSGGQTYRDGDEVLVV